MAISIITASEVIVKIPEKEREKTFGALSDIFEILPFDKNAAINAAGIFSDKYIKPSLGDRVALKDDIKILASIKTIGGNELYTDDKKFKTLASRYDVTILS